MLEGSLSDFSLPDIFQLLALTKKTGALTVQAGGQEGRVLFQGGEVSFAVSDVHRVALGARLVAAGLVDEGQVTRVLERKREEEGDVLALLLDEAMLDEGAVDGFLRSQIEDAVFDLMRLEDAAFTFDASAGGEAAGVTVATEQLITEGTRRMGEWSAIREQVPSLEAVFTLASEPAAGDGGVTVTSEEWRLLALVDGRRTVRDIVGLTGQGEFATCKGLAALVERRLIHVARDEESTDGALAGMVARREMLRRLEELELGAEVVRPESPAPRRPAAPEAPAQQETPTPQYAEALTEAPEPAPTAEPVAREPAPPADPGPDAAERAAGVGDASDLFDLGTAADDSWTDAGEPPADAADDWAVAHELSSLGQDEPFPVPPAHGGAEAAPEPANGDRHPDGEKLVRRLTRDEDVNKGLLLRLIDGVKEA